MTIPLISPSILSADFAALGEEVRARVKETSGITLEWEIRRIGMREGEGA